MQVVSQYLSTKTGRCAIRVWGNVILSGVKIMWAKWNLFSVIQPDTRMKLWVARKLPFNGPRESFLHRRSGRRHWRQFKIAFSMKSLELGLWRKNLESTGEPRVYILSLSVEGASSALGFGRRGNYSVPNLCGNKNAWLRPLLQRTVQLLHTVWLKR